MAWFPEKDDPELERLAQLIWDLRREKFCREILERPHERVWEEEDARERREARNEKKVHEFDLETIRIIRGNADRREGEVMEN